MTEGTNRWALALLITGCLLAAIAACSDKDLEDANTAADAGSGGHGTPVMKQPVDGKQVLVGVMVEDIPGPAGYPSDRLTAKVRRLGSASTASSAVRRRVEFGPPGRRNLTFVGASRGLVAGR